ncbi:radical SAM domain-containing protein [mine drainage metagenome]|uniref:Radical SAM domain-containing protein n=2 Tax=mine drainage metagenome TaxID=410659 RepID=T0ZP31_9ZZZZ
MLINPRSPESFWSFRWALRELLPDKRAINPPLGLATLAALTPVDWEISIFDENIEPLPTDPKADIVGIGGMAVQFPRQRELLHYYREKGYHVVIGGSYASLSPSTYEGLADTLIVGEAELVWPEFCRDFEHGLPGKQYCQPDPVDLRHTPTPRFDLLNLSAYTTASLQFSRGCPYLCEFCDIPVLFGRKPRTKTLAQIHNELEALRPTGIHDVFFVDDNLIGYRPRAKALLEFLAEYQRSHDYPFSFGTEVSVNLATDPELLGRLRAAGFRWVFLGIETPDMASLAEAGKKQNLRGNLLDAVRVFYRNGIDVFSGFIVGFDHDTVETFERQYRFIEASGIQVAMLGLLTAVPRTPLYERLQRDRRLRLDVQPGDNTGGQTNVVPLRMSYDEMAAGYAALCARLTTHRAIATRIRNKLRYYRESPVPRQRDGQASRSVLRRLITRGISKGGLGCVASFLWSLWGVRPSLWSLACQDWAAGFSIREYTQRYIQNPPLEERMFTERYISRLARKLRNPITKGCFKIDLEPFRKPVRLRMVIEQKCGTLDLKAALATLDHLLRGFRTLTLVLVLKELPTGCNLYLRQWIDRLGHYSDRVTVEWEEALIHGIDSSRVAVTTRTSG